MTDVRAAVKYAKIAFNGPIHLLGSSQGGITALYLASEGIEVASIMCQNIADLTGKGAHRLSRFPVLSIIGKPALKVLSKLAPCSKGSYSGIPSPAQKVKVKHFGNAQVFMQEDPLALNRNT